nr:splicing factor [Tanacetum cinerariifolium]
MGGCRRILRLDCCFLKHICKDQLLTTIGRDANKEAGENNSQETKHGKRREPNVQYASAKCRGRGFKCRDIAAMGAESDGRGQVGTKSGGRGQIDVESYGRGGMGSSIRAMGTDSGGRGGRSDGKETIDDIKKSMEDEHMQGLFIEQEVLRKKKEKEHQDKLDEEALQQAREEDLMFERIDLEREREEQQ